MSPFVLSHSATSRLVCGVSNSIGNVADASSVARPATSCSKTARCDLAVSDDSDLLR
jgi:hypothetical protein